MTNVTRRSALLGAAAAAVATPAYADLPANLRSHPGFRAWTPAVAGARLPLQAPVQTEAGEVTLSHWLQRRPAVLALWASWCAPCLLEKPPQASLACRLQQSGAATRVLALQAFDDDRVSFADGCWMLNEMGASGLQAARASTGAETGLREVFQVRDRRIRATLPAVLLIGGDGLEIGRAIGMMRGPGGRGDYWTQESTFDFLSRLV